MSDVLTDIGAERAFIDAVLRDPAVMALRGKLEPEDFTDPALAAVFAEAVSLAERSEPINPITMRPVLDMVRTANGQTAREYLAANTVSGVTPEPIAIAQHLHVLATRRMLVDIGRDLRADALDGVTPIKDVVTGIRTRLNDAVSMHLDAGNSTSFASHLDTLHRYFEGTTDPMFRTGIDSIDRDLGGFFHHDFVILAGRPSMGKSAVAHEIALNTGLRGEGVLIVSLEMPGHDVVARMISSLMARKGFKLPYVDVLKRTVDNDDLRYRFYQASDAYRSLPIKIVGAEHGTDMLSLIAHIENSKRDFEKAGTRLALIVVDHIGLMKVSNRYRGNRVQEVAELSSGLATLARTEKVPLIALAQLNREVEKRENRWPEMSDLRDSGSLEQDASTIILVYRQVYYLEKMLESASDDNTIDVVDVKADIERFKNDITLNAAKVRNGPVKIVRGRIEIEVNRVT